MEYTTGERPDFSSLPYAWALEEPRIGCVCGNENAAWWEAYMRHTPLYDEHTTLGGKLVDFNGWALPVQFSGIVKEHLHTRAAASLFDCSHMGEFHIRGREAIEKYDRAVISDVFAIPVGRCRLGAILNESGGIVDDLITIRLAEDEVYVVNNAGPVDKLVDAICEDNPGAAHVSYETAKIDIQGPDSRAILLSAGFEEAETLKYFNACWSQWKGERVLLSRTGYTGELGYELFMPNALAVDMWRMFLREVGVRPAGLGARDTLRTEVGYNLSGQDFDETTTPLEAGMESFVAWDTEFIGKEALVRRRDAGGLKVLAGIRTRGRQAPRHDFAVHAGSETVGVVTSGTYGPSVGHGVGLARLQHAHAEPGTVLRAGPKSLEIEVASLPFYKDGTCRQTLVATGA